MRWKLKYFLAGTTDYVQTPWINLHSLNTMDTNINESCKEASREGVTLKFVKLKDANHGKRLDPI